MGQALSTLVLSTWMISTSEAVRISSPYGEDDWMEVEAETTFGQFKQMLTDQHIIKDESQYEFTYGDDAESIIIDDDESLYDNGIDIYSDTIHYQIQYKYVARQKLLHINNEENKPFDEIRYYNLCVEMLDNMDTNNEEQLTFVKNCVIADLPEFDKVLSERFEKWAKKNQLSKVKMLIELGIDVNTRFKDDCTALTWAARKEYLQLFSYLLMVDADVNMQDSTSKTALIWAARQENLDMVTRLLITDANVNIQDLGGETALMWAVGNQDERIVEQLLISNADVNIKDNTDMTALMIAVLKNRWNNNNIISLLLAAGADVNAQNLSGNTPLMAATRVRDINVAQKLLNAGADVTLRNQEGKSALDMWPELTSLQKNKL